MTVQNLRERLATIYANYANAIIYVKDEHGMSHEANQMTVIYDDYDNSVDVVIDYVE